MRPVRSLTSSASGGTASGWIMERSRLAVWAMRARVWAGRRLTIAPQPTRPRARVGDPHGQDTRADRTGRADRLARGRGERGRAAGREARPRDGGPGPGGDRSDVLRAVAVVRRHDDREDRQAAAELAPARLAALAARLPAW